VNDDDGPRPSGRPPAPGGRQHRGSRRSCSERPVMSWIDLGESATSSGAPRGGAGHRARSTASLALALLSEARIIEAASLGAEHRLASAAAFAAATSMARRDAVDRRLGWPARPPAFAPPPLAVRLDRCPRLPAHALRRDDAIPRHPARPCHQSDDRKGSTASAVILSRGRGWPSPPRPATASFPHPRRRPTRPRRTRPTRSSSTAVSRPSGRS
jgi:hypothetical protein